MSDQQTAQSSGSRSAPGAGVSGTLGCSRSPHSETQSVEIETREVTRPDVAVSPDGESIAYLTYEPVGMWAQYEFVAPGGLQTQVRWISPQGGPPETLTNEPGFIHAVVYLPDGRLAWTPWPRPGLALHYLNR